MKTRKDSLSEEDVLRVGMFVQEEARLLAQLAELDRVEQDVRERDGIQQGRPDGCACLGVGGTGPLICVYSDGLPVFDGYCSCEDGERARDAAAWADEALVEEERRRRDAEEQERQQRRTRDILVRSGIEQRYEACTFDSLRTLLEKRRLMNVNTAKYLKTIEQAYGVKGPGRGDYLWGAAGHGKTSTAISALRAWIGRGKVGRFVGEGDFLDAMHAGMDTRDGTGTALLESLKTVPLLVFDDLAMVVRSAYDRSLIVSLIVARHAANLPTFFTSNYPISEAALRLSDGDGMELGRLERRLREMCDEFQLVTGQLGISGREEVVGRG